MFKEH